MGRRGDGKSMTFGESISRKSLDFEYESRQLWCGPWRWYRGVGEIHMNKGRVAEESKEMDGCPLTGQTTNDILRITVPSLLVPSLP
jgi:hypothetical protein